MTNVKTVIIRKGTTLYHGTPYKLNGDIPNKQGGSWFSTNKNQSVYHAIAGPSKRQILLYKYKVIKPIKVIYFSSIANFDKWCLNQGFAKIANANFALFNRYGATKICSESEYAGWSMPSLQRQVMLCKPKEYLRLSEIYRVSETNITGIEFTNKTVTGGNLLWMPTSGSKYKLVKANRNKLEKINEPPKNHVYWYVNRNETGGRMPVFVNSQGVVLARGRNKVVIENNKPVAIQANNGRKIYIKGDFRKNVNTLHRNTLRARTKKYETFYSFAIA